MASGIGSGKALRTAIIAPSLTSTTNLFSYLLGKNCARSYGGTQKGREASLKLFHLSAAAVTSFALLGGGVQVLKSNYFVEKYFGSKHNYRFWKTKSQAAGSRASAVVKPNFWISRLGENLRKAFNQLQTSKKVGDVFGLAKPFTFLNILVTPVSCDCDNPTCPPPKHEECETPKPAPPPPKKEKKCGTKHSGCGCSRASDPGIDLDALSQQLGGMKQMDWSMESDLSHCLLMRQAAQVAVDSVTRIVTETCSAYEDYQCEYRRILDLLMDALEDSRRACGSEVEVIECKIILIRAKADELKRKIQEVDCFMGSLEKFCQSAAEVAFMCHAEYASIAMSERLQSMCQEVKRLRAETKEKEKDMLELQSLIIVETGKGLK